MKVLNSKKKRKKNDKMEEFKNLKKDRKNIDKNTLFA